MKKMLKKAVNIILTIGLLFQNFAFLTPVFADTNDNPQIIINSITQNEEELTKEGNVYIAPDLGEISINIDITPHAEDYTYFVIISNGDNRSIYGNSENLSIEPYINYANEINEYTITLCYYDDYECEEPLASLPFKVKFLRYSELANTNIYVEKVMQGGKQVNPVFGYMLLNDVEDITFSIKGENLIDDEYYAIYTNYETEHYTGSELENGIELVFNPEGKEYLNLSYEIYGMNNDLKYKKNDSYQDIYYNFYTDDSIANFTPKLMYTNYKDIELDKIEFFYDNEKSIIRNAYHNNNNTLTYRISAHSYQNQIYPIKVVVYGDDNKIYDETFNVNGELLNEGYDLELTNLYLGETVYGNYKFEITIDNITKKQEFGYDSYKINIKNIYQGNNILNKVDDVYQAPGFANLYADLQIETSNLNRKIELVVATDSGRSSHQFDPNNKERLDIDLSKKDNTYKLYLCDDFECDKYYGDTEIKVSLTNFDTFKDGKINLTKIMQDKKEININSNLEFHMNRIQDVEFYFKGENLIDDLDYTIRIGYNASKTVKGSVLEEGIKIVLNTKDNVDELNNFSINMLADEAYINNYCYNNGTVNYCTNDDYIKYMFDKQETVPNYIGRIKYTNYMDTEIKLVERYMYNVYGIKSDYHNSNNSLTYRLEGSNFENKDYTVSLKVKRDNKDYFEKDYTVNGSLINAGYNLELTGLTLAKRTSSDILYNIYDMSFTIASVTSSSSYYYNSIGKPVYMNSDLYNDENKISGLTPTNGTDTNESIYPVNRHLFDNNNKINVKFRGYNFDKTNTYNYIIEYGYIESVDELYKSKYTTEIKTGTISGTDLIDNGINIAVNNPNNYTMPAYRIIVKNGDELLSIDGIAFNFVDYPSIIETMIKSDNKTLKENSDGILLAPLGKDVTMTFYGIGFEDKDYEFNICSRGESNNYYDNNESCNKVKVKGSDINNGIATITLNHDTDKYKKYSINIDTTSYELSNSLYYYIEYYEEGNYIISEGSFEIDSNNIIKEIPKELEANKVLKEITLAENYTAKIFDKNGTKEVTGIVGTGMIFRIYDSNNQVVDELVLAVKGDLSGDGKMTITDIVKAKKHVANVELLTGAYKIAGDITNTGDISITDLIKMARDVAGIEEIW